MPKHPLVTAFFLFFFTQQAQAIILTAGQNDYSTVSNIITDGIGISSSLSGTSPSLNKIKNLHIITTGNSGAVSGSYGIRSSGNYNQVTNSLGAEIFTSGISGRGISLANNSIAINSGVISTLGITSYGIYVGGNGNSISSSGAITTTKTTSYAIYLNGDHNSAINSGIISTKVYGIYGNGNVNQITNFGTISTSTNSSAHGIYVSGGSASSASITNFSTINNSGIINSTGNGIYNKDNFSSITNSGTIITASSSSICGIRNEGGNSVISNSGNINSAIYNSGIGSVINNSGVISGGVYLGTGTLNILGGSIGSEVDGTGTGNINVVANFSQRASFVDIDNLTILSSSTLNSFANISANRILIDANSILILGEGATTSAAIQGVSNSVGTLNISFSLSIKSIGILGNALANLNIDSGASLTSASDIYAANILVAGDLNFLDSDNLIIHGNISGSGSATINIGSKNQIISGSFSLNSGDTLALVLKNNGVGNFIISNIVTIDSNAKLAISTSIDQGYIASGTKYRILQAGSSSIINLISTENISLNSENSNIYGLLKFSTSATADSLILNIDRLAPEEITPNKNIQNIYQNLNEIGINSGGKLLEFQEYLGSVSGEEIAKTINQLAPQSSKAALTTTNNIVSNSITIAENRLEKIDSKVVLKNGFWVQGFGGLILQKLIKDDEGYRANSTGIAFGGDKEFGDENRIGLSLSMAKSGIKNLDKNQENQVYTYQTNIYGSKNFDKYFFDAIAAFAINQFNSNREIKALDSNASAKYFGQTYGLKIKSGSINKLQKGFNLIPEISINFLHNNIAGYSEKGADELNLTVGKIAANFLETRVGLNLIFNSKAYPEFPDFQKFTAAFKISYGHAFINDVPAMRASFKDQQTNFISQISHQDKESLKLGIGFFAIHSDNTILSFDYNFEHKTTSGSHFILMKIREEF